MEVTERFMRLLESLDSLRFDSSDPTSRGRRKAMVDKIQVGILWGESKVAVKRVLVSVVCSV